MRMQQPDLPGLDLPPIGRPERLFFAVVPDAPATASIVHIAGALHQAGSASARPVSRERFHVSTHFVCDWPRQKARHVMAAQHAAATVRLPPFDLALSSAMTFEPFGGRADDQRPLVLVADAVGVWELQAALAAAMGLRRPAAGRRGTPHVTLSYGGPPVAARPIAPICWTAREFVLLHSRRDRRAYEVLGRWPLGLAA